MASIETIEQVKERIEELDPAEAQEELRKGGVALIDTREPNEYIEAHIDGAELVRPVDVAERIEEVVPDRSAAGDPLLRLRQPLRARRRSAPRARLRERRLRRAAASRPGRPRAFPSSCPRA